MKRVLPSRGAGSILALSLSIAASGVIAPVLPGADVFSAKAVSAAESRARQLSKDEVFALVKKLVEIPDGYRLEQSQLEKPGVYSDYYDPVWNLYLRKEKEGGMHFTVNAVSGKLLRFFHYREKPDHDRSDKVIGAKEAERVAQDFLQKAMDKQEAEKLSKANEYEGQTFEFGSTFTRSFTYTRVENGIPFLENHVQISVDAEGRVTQFSRRWYEGKLPSAKAGITLEEAEKKLADSARPSLSYVRVSDYVGDYGFGYRPYTLVYRYGANDAVMVDASRGELLNRLGQPVKEGTGIQPLGSTIRKRGSSEKRITKEEAQKIADDLIKRFPGSYTSEGSGGYGTSTGPDGIVHRDWSFRYVPVNAKENERAEIHMEISDTGELRGFSNDANRRYDRENKIENPISWEQAEKNAVEIVKTLFADRLGELYLLSQKPSAEALKKQAESGMMRYSIVFGWLKDGIPVENATLQVEVNAETGHIMHMWTGRDWQELTNDQASKPTVDGKAAKQKEAEKKKVMLTYFQSYPDWRFKMGGDEKGEPLLVYRYVGEEGVVDAGTGEWISFRELRERQHPQDIEKHPKKGALLFAIEQGILKAKDGKVEPDKPVTRGELITMVVPIANRFPIGERMFRHDEEDESMKPYLFEDVDVKSDYFPAIQQAIRLGIIPKEGKIFQPDSEASRLEFAEMVVRLAGYEKLLGKPGIFKSSYSDVAKEDVPTVALLKALEVWEGNGGEFQPNSKVTRAEVAEVFQKLFKTVSR